MTKATEIIHSYLRHNKKFPHVLCPGCGHGIFLGSLVRTIHQLGWEKDDVALVAGIGCSGRLAVYVDFNTLHTTHGRALTFATGIKMANPKLHVIVLMGDGDALSIGGNHLIHAARRNIGLTAIILNNNIYGMTGGQASPTTPTGARSMTTPFGQMEQPFDIVSLATAAGANLVARATSYHVKLMDRMLAEAFTNPGFSLVEVLSPCFTQYGRKNSYKNIPAMYEELKETAMDHERLASLDDDQKKGKIPIGLFVKKDRPGLEQQYQALQRQLADSSGGGA